MRRVTSLDPGVLASVGRAADLAATNARLQAQVERQRVEVEASRRRLAGAADQERRDLRERVTTGLGPHLTALADELEGPASA